MTATFEEWLAKLPKWLQTAASDFLTKETRPTKTEIIALADLCIAEVSGAPANFSQVPAGTFDSVQDGQVVRLRRIDSISGANALDSKASLDFGDADLAIVYGHNGTGKSGFARLTKHAAGVRVRNQLIPNVFGADIVEPQAAFSVERSGVLSTETWTQSSGALNSLRHLQVFDSEVARHYVSAKSEASYEPRRLRFLTTLVEICDQVRAELEARRLLSPVRIPAIPSELATTKLAGYLRGLNAKHEPAEVSVRCAPAEGHADRMRELGEALRTQDTAVRLKDVHKLLVSLRSTGEGLTRLAEGLSDARAADLVAAKATARAARKVASEDADTIFRGSALTGIGGDSWHAMWKAAREYSKNVAYPGCDFPHLVAGSHCPLCQQLLDDQARKRLSDFESFVRGELEARARLAEQALGKALEALPTLPAEADFLTRFASIRDAEPIAQAAFAAASARRTALMNAEAIADVPATDFGPLRQLVATQISDLEKERLLLEAANAQSSRALLQAELLELRMFDWAKENRQAILDELARLKTLELLDRAAKKATTAAITKKKKELSEEELTGGYQKRFADELKALGGGRIPVKPVAASNAKGRTEFALTIVNPKRDVRVDDVLSEGEGRIVALAAFLADVTVAGAKTPFVFDDPISSLDQDFEERVVARLITLARTRQVLVFTHRISLLTLLKDAAKKELPLGPLKVTEIALRRLGAKIGLATDINVREGKVEKALNNILNARLSEAKKHSDAGDVEAFTSAMQTICSDFRILVERTVEEELLNRVVLRFRRAVQTDGRVGALAKITSEDCALVDDLMTRYSCFEHSQPEQGPAPIPELFAIQADVTRLRDFVVEFAKRPAPPKKVDVMAAAKPSGKSINVVKSGTSGETPL